MNEGLLYEDLDDSFFQKRRYISSWKILLGGGHNIHFILNWITEIQEDDLLLPKLVQF